MRKNPITLGQLLNYLDEIDTVLIAEGDWEHYSDIFADSMLLQQYSDWHIDRLELITTRTIRVKLTPPVYIVTPKSE